MITEGTIIIAVLLSVVTLAVPRKYFLLPYVIAACFVPTDQRIIIADLDFTVLRMLIVVGVVRTIVRGEQRTIRWNKFDRMILAWALCGAVIYVMQWHTMSVAIYKCGILFDIFGLFWLFRMSITSWDDIALLGRVFAVCSLVLAVFVAIEWATGVNPFAALGRVGTGVREERYRCQASFPHSIMLGLFWASVIPLFIGLLKTGYHHRWLYIAATVASVFMVLATASSTPIVALGVVLLVVPWFRYRHYGRHFVWAILGTLVALHIVMQAPVWNLMARVNIIGGSTGWHRYHLLNEAINHFSEWALLGTKSTSHWGVGLQDVTNQYVLEGVRGGLITLVLFIGLLVMAIRGVWSFSLKVTVPKQQWLAWGICVSLIGHCVSFFGVSYFGQITMLLYLTFAMVGWIFGLTHLQPYETIPAGK